MEDMDVEVKFKDSKEKVIRHRREEKQTGREGKNESWRGSDTRRERKREKG